MKASVDGVTVPIDVHINFVGDGPQQADVARLLNRLHHAEALAESRRVALDGAKDLAAILSQRVVAREAELAALHDLLAPADEVAGAIRAGSVRYPDVVRRVLLALADWIASP